MKRYLSVALVFALVSAAVFSVVPSSVVAGSLSGFTVTNATVVGGKSAIGSVKLDAAAPTGGLVVSLSSSDTSLATVPDSVTVAAGRTATSAMIKTKGVASNRTVIITASAAGVSRSLTLTLTPAGLSAVSAPKSIAGGATGSGTVTLTGAAPAGGLVVSLSATGGVASVPVTVAIAAGASSAKFTIATTPVSTATPATITATLGAVSKSVSFSVVLPTVLSVSMSPTKVGPGVSGTGTVRLTGPAPSGGARVTITLDTPGPLTIPSSVTIPAGGISATFTVTGQAVTSSTKVTLRAAYGNSRTVSITVSPAELYSVRLSPTSIVHDGTATGTVTLTADAPSGGLTVTLVRSNAALTIPASVTVPAGARTATFTVTGNSPAVQTSVRVTGTTGTVSKYGSIIVKAAPPAPVALAELAVLPNPVGGQSLVGIGILLTSPAPAAGFPVTVSSSNQSLLPLSGTYNITSGNDFLTLFPTTAAVSSQQQVVVTVSAGGKTLTATVTILPYALYSVNLPASGVSGGSTATGRVYLTGAAPAGGVSVSLSSSDSGVASVPATVTIPAGQTNVAFAITTSAVSASRSVTITAQAGGASVSSTMTVEPLKVTGFGTFPSSLTSGNSGTAVISINGVPGPGGAAITLTSSNPSVASVPASVTITSGTSAIFQVTAGAVTAPTTVTISASLGGATVSKTVTVSPPALQGVSVATSILLETTASGQVTLSGAAPSGGVTVSLASSDPAAAQVPASVTIPAGATSAAFTVVAGAVTQPVNVTITASAPGVSRSVTTQVIPIGPWQGQLSTAARSCSSGGGNFSFKLSGPAPAGGLTVAITGTNGMIAPASVVVPAGATSFSVNACAYPILGNLSGSLTASANGLSARYVLTIPKVSQGLAVSSTTVTGGTPFDITWSISEPAGPGGLTNTITSSNAAVVPGFTLTIPEGSKSVTTTLVAPVLSAAAVVNLRAPGYWSDDVTFTIVLPKVSDLIIAPADLVGGDGATGSVTIDGPAPSGGLTVNLVSDSPFVQVPLTVQVPAGATSATFAITTAAVEEPVAAVVTASSGSGSAAASVTVQPPAVAPESTSEELEMESTPPAEEPSPEATPGADEPAPDSTPVEGAGAQGGTDGGEEPVADPTQEPEATPSA